jgi:hypothetical protein
MAFLPPLRWQKILEINTYLYFYTVYVARAVFTSQNLFVPVQPTLNLRFPLQAQEPYVALLRSRYHERFSK